ncbi:MAG: hypothetical protein V1808_04630 [Candidatus Daviesbacteria bacterium]
MLNKKFLILILIIPFLLNKPVTAQENFEIPENKIESKVIDQRAQILQAYLSKYNSPLQYQSQDFVDAADKYNLDWRLVAAISGVESTFGKHIPGGYNAWGWGVYGTQAIYFKSWTEGIFTVSEGLRKNYLNKGLTNPYDINRIYAASPTWGSHVSFFLADMEKFEDEYGKNQAQIISANFLTQTAGASAILN